MLNTLSTPSRNEVWDSMQRQHYDLIIIGGGITGAGIALDAISRNLKVALFEKNDFASGTSSRSTKLLHGGLRYLQQLKFKLVHDVGRERRIALKNAPHLVTPARMLLPIFRNGTYRKWSASIGLWIYDLLAGVSKNERRIMLSKKKAGQQEPLLNQKELTGAGLYYEYQTDDARLTLEVVRTAVSLGAHCLNYAEVTGFVFKEDKIAGVRVMNKLVSKTSANAQIADFSADVIVNASGPWTDELLKMDTKPKKNLHHTKGVHIVVAHDRLPARQALYGDVFDGRMFFVIPKRNTTYIGTTDTDYTGDLDKPRVTKEDAEYLIAAVNRVFPSVHLRSEDIISSWAGIRPLIQEEGKPPSEISRKDEIFIASSGLITIAGGKLTGYRRMAEKIVDMVLKNLNKKFVSCKTEHISLSQAPVPTFTDSIVLSLAHAVSQEAVTNLSDFLIRRTGYLYFEREKIEWILPAVTDELSRLLFWSEETKEKYVRDFMEEYYSALPMRE